MQPTDDSALLRQFAESNSDEAFAALVTRHINLVYSVALRQTGNPHAAEEITQAVFIILAKKASALRHDKALSSWLFQATRLTANNFIRSETRRHRREQEAHMQSILNEPETGVWPKIAPLLDSAVAGLREKDRQAIVLRFYEGRNLREVGLVLGTSEDAAEKRVSRALEKLRKFFAKHGVCLTTAIIAGAISANSAQAAPIGLAKTISAVAITKGAAASGSTLTLIKGALKIMAWTKAKTAVVVGVVTILAAISTTVIGIKMARAHRAPPDTTFNVTFNIQPDGTTLLKFTAELANNSSRTMIADGVGDTIAISRITDESGKPMKFAKRPRPGGGYDIFLNKPVPPGGQFSYTVEGTVMGGMFQSKSFGAGEYGVNSANNLGYSIEVHLVEVWRLPPGAVLLEQIGGMEETTNSGQIELKIDQILPPNGSAPVGFRYRLPANAN
jgi:RNA polymerase sigma factor (sigma-70 family)